MGASEAGVGLNYDPASPRFSPGLRRDLERAAVLNHREWAVISSAEIKVLILSYSIFGYRFPIHVSCISSSFM